MAPFSRGLGESKKPGWPTAPIAHFAALCENFCEPHHLADAGHLRAAFTGQTGGRHTRRRFIGQGQQQLPATRGQLLAAVCVCVCARALR